MEIEHFRDDVDQRIAAEAAAEHGVVGAGANRADPVVEDAAEPVGLEVGHVEIGGAFDDHVGGEVGGEAAGGAVHAAAGIEVVDRAAGFEARVAGGGCRAADHGGGVFDRGGEPELIRSQVLGDAELCLAPPVQAHHVLRIDLQRQVDQQRVHPHLVGGQQRPGLAAQDVAAPVASGVADPGLAQAGVPAVAFVIVRGRCAAEEVAGEEALQFGHVVRRGAEGCLDAGLPRAQDGFGLVVERAFTLRDAGGEAGGKVGLLVA